MNSELSQALLNLSLETGIRFNENMDVGYVVKVEKRKHNLYNVRNDYYKGLVSDLILSANSEKKLVELIKVYTAGFEEGVEHGMWKCRNGH